jgi:hypothetical protein
MCTETNRYGEAKRCTFPDFIANVPEIIYKGDSLNYKKVTFVES